MTLARRILPIILTSAGLVLAPLAAAQTFPNRPIKVIVPYSPGGGTDVLGRLVGQEVSTAVGQPVVVENRPGGGANIGAELVVRAAPDGYTLLVENSNFAMTAGMFPNLTFDKGRDFTPVAIIGSTPSMLIVNPQLAVRTVAELVALVRAQPGKYAYASCGTGAPQHLAGELFKQMAKLDMAHVPYKGCAPGLADLVGGQVMIGFNTAVNALPHVRSGKARALAVTGLKRFGAAPDLPTMDESGLSGYDVDQWFGFFVPAKTPAEVVKRLHAEITAAVGKPELREKMSGQGYAVITMGQEQFATLVRNDIARWTKFTKEVGIKPD